MPRRSRCDPFEANRTPVPRGRPGRDRQDSPLYVRRQGSLPTDERTQDAVLRNIEIIGEAVRGVAEETRDAHAEVPWKEMAGMRNRVIHHYFRVDIDVVWDIISQDLPPLREKIASLLE